MTPQERQLVADLFERLAALEGAPRDPEAERAIAQESARAPNAVYALVQTVLLQDEALKRADARIRDLQTGREDDRGQSVLDPAPAASTGGDQRRGSVPSIREPSKWNVGPVAPSAQPVPPSYDAEPARGGSFLGTAAATAAGMIGGGLLFGAIRSLIDGRQGAAFGAPYGEAFDRPQPWGDDASRSGLARDAGIDDVGGHRGANGDAGLQPADMFSQSGDGGLEDDGFDLGDDGSNDISDA